MNELKEYLPYIVSILVAVITGVMSYLASAKSCRTELKALQESNKHEINRLMEQHKLDIDSLERKHQMEIEKMELEHRHQIELKQKEMESAFGGQLLTSVVDAAMNTPEARQAMGQAFRNSKKK